MRQNRLADLITGLLFTGASPARAATHPDVTVTGAGATFPANMVEQWKADFKKSDNVTIAYTAVGSGAGRTQLIAGTVDFAASDVAAKPEEATQLKEKYGDFVYIPVTSGGIAILFKVPGLTSLRLTGPTLAKIFAGTITNWKDDAAIAADNGVAGPDLPIQVFSCVAPPETRALDRQPGSQHYRTPVPQEQWSPGRKQFDPGSTVYCRAGPGPSALPTFRTVSRALRAQTASGHLRPSCSG